MNHPPTLKYHACLSISFLVMFEVIRIDFEGKKSLVLSPSRLSSLSLSFSLLSPWSHCVNLLDWEMNTPLSSQVAQTVKVPGCNLFHKTLASPSIKNILDALSKRNIVHEIPNCSHMEWKSHSKVHPHSLVTMSIFLLWGPWQVISHAGNALQSNFISFKSQLSPISSSNELLRRFPFQIKVEQNGCSRRDTKKRSWHLKKITHLVVGMALTGSLYH